MADSNITKKALALALRELMEEIPFEKIQVSYICERCGMNRKSFYYHFKDKYDLLNWIFDTDFIAFAQASKENENIDNRIELIQEVCNYFYKNRNFYRKALKIKGQNSFSDHFKEYVLPIFKYRLIYLLGDEDVDEFTVNFVANASLNAIELWLMDKNTIPPDKFVLKLMSFFQSGAKAIQKELSQSNKICHNI